MSQHQIPSFQSWRPKSKDEILNHYYQNSDGASLPKWFADIQAFADKVKVEIANALIPGSGKIVAAINVFDLQKISSSAKRRKQLDSSKEKQRIFDLYKREYTNSTFPNNIRTKTDQEIETWLKGVQNQVNISREKCKKRDTAGCRFMGILNLRYQYGKFVLEARKQMRMSGTPQPSLANSTGSISAPSPARYSSGAMDQGNRKTQAKGIIGWIMKVLGLN